MKHIFPILTMSAVSFSVWTAPAQDVDSVRVASNRSRQNTLSARAASALRQHTSVSAKMRQRSNLFGEQLIGSGSYDQLGTGDLMRFRMEMKIQVGEYVNSLQQVCDGRFFWVRTDSADDSSISRVDLERVRRAVGEIGDVTQPARWKPWHAIGGLPRLISQLDRSFRFGKPQNDTLHGVPVWILRGGWTQPCLAKLIAKNRKGVVAGSADRIGVLPDHVPNQVALVLGQDDLFPYQIEFYRTTVDDIPTASPGSGSGGHTLVKMDLFEVRIGAALDPQLFEYNLGDVEVIDRTDKYIATLDVK